MADLDLLKGVAAKTVDTPRLRTYLLTGGAEGGAPIFFVHGNASSSRFFEETLAALPKEGRYGGVAPDLRGFGDSETKPVDATRGLADFSDDLYALADALGFGEQKIHLVGWSVGGGIVLRYALDHPDGVASLILINPLSPYGFGGTEDASGTPCWPDYAGSGGGLTSPEFIQRLKAGDRSGKDLNSPRNVMNGIYFKPPFKASKEREEVLLSSMLATKVGEGNYPGDATPSNNWPHVAPGTKGMNNAISPKYCDLQGFARIDPKPPVLWLRGADDMFVSDTSLRDFGYLGQLGLAPGWPGKEVYPPQPMVSQTRALLEAYVQNGGRYREAVIEDCGHSPHVERPEAFRRGLFGFIEKYS
ncbi:MAG: alpha/beta hydrolase [Pseudomonadota bacterium]|nr:alpha/beta hydrolase [Pseudomonadota bacterium]